MRKIIFFLSLIFFQGLTFSGWSQKPVDNDSLDIIVYNKIKSLEDFFLLLIDNRMLSAFCSGAVKKAYESEDRIFFSDETMIKNDLFENISGDTARNLPVQEYFTNFLNELSENKITGYKLKDFQVSPLKKGGEYKYFSVNCTRVLIKGNDSSSISRKIEYRVDNDSARFFISSIGNPAKSAAGFRDLDKSIEKYLRQKVGKDYLALTPEERDSIVGVNFKENLLENAKIDLFKEEARQTKAIRDSLVQSYIKTAQQYQNQEEWERAEEELNKAARIDSTNFLLIAEKKTLEDKRPSFEKLKKQAETYYIQRDLEKALDNFKTANSLVTPPDEIVKNRVEEINTILSKIRKENSKMIEGRIDEAIRDFQNLTRTNPDVPEYYERLGACLEQKNLPDSALKNYEMADKYGLNAAKLNMARIYKKIKRYYDAQEQYIKFLYLYENDDSVYNELAEVRYVNFLQDKKKNALDEAIESVSKAIEINDSNYHYYFNRGLYYYESEKISESKSDFNKSIALKSSEPLSYYYRGKLFLKEKNYKEAGSDFDTAKAKGLGKIETDAIFAVSTSLGGQGASLLENKKYDEALEVLHNSIFVCKINYEAYYNRGVVLLNKKNYENAKKDFTEAVKENKYRDKGIFYQGECDFYMGNFSSCIELLVPLTAQPFLNDSLKLQAYNFIGKSFFERKNFEKAITNFDFSININKNQPEIHFLTGLSNFNLKKYDLSIDNISKAIKLKEDEPQYYYYRGLSYLKIEEWKNAIDDFQETIAKCTTRDLKIKWKDAFKYKGDAELYRKLYQEAFNSYNQFVSLDANNPEGYFYRATALEKLEKVPEAIHNYKTALEKDTSHQYTVLANVKIGDLYYLNDSLGQAFKYYSVVHETANENSCDQSLPGLAKIKMRNDEIDNAVGFLKKYIQKCKPDIKELSKELQHDKNLKKAMKDSKIKAILQN